jgi:hypothetical protein
MFSMSSDWSLDESHGNKNSNSSNNNNNKSNYGILASRMDSEMRHDSSELAASGASGVSMEPSILIRTEKEMTTSTPSPAKRKEPLQSTSLATSLRDSERYHGNGTTTDESLVPSVTPSRVSSSISPSHDRNIVRAVRIGLTNAFLVLEITLSYLLLRNHSSVFTLFTGP